LRQFALPEQAPIIARPAKRMVRWLPAGIGAAAAAVLAILVGPALMRPADRSFATNAAPRTIALADGSRITLAPRSRLVISGSDANAMQLTGGGWFDIRHVAARELAITAGPVTIRDIGTRFDVQADGGSARVAVAQGQVTIASPALTQPIALAGGRALLFDDQQRVATVTSANIADIGGWRQDRLSYKDVALALVADDLGRYADIHLDVPAGLRSRRFSGTLIVGNGIEAPRDLAQLMGLALVRGPDGLRLAPRGNRAPPS
jgi:transmembrane sensor